MAFVVGFIIGGFLGMLGLMFFQALQIAQDKVPRGLRYFLELRKEK